MSNNNEIKTLFWWQAAEKVLRELGPNKDGSSPYLGHHYAYIAKFCVKKNIKRPKGNYETIEQELHQASMSINARIGDTIRGITTGDTNLFMREPGGLVALKEWKEEWITEILAVEDVTIKDAINKEQIRSLNEVLDEVFEEVKVNELLLTRIRRYSDTQLEHLVASLLADLYPSYSCIVTREKGRGSQPWGDILLVRPSPISDERERIIVEVKGGTDLKKPRLIRSEELDALGGKLLKQGVSEAIFVTNGVFHSKAEEDALKYRRSGKIIRLIDGARLVQIWTERMRLKGEYGYQSLS